MKLLQLLKLLQLTLLLLLLQLRLLLQKLLLLRKSNFRITEKNKAAYTAAFFMLECEHFGFQLKNGLSANTNPADVSNKLVTVNIIASIFCTPGIVSLTNTLIFEIGRLAWNNLSSQSADGLTSKSAICVNFK